MEDTIKNYIASLLRNLATPIIVWLAATGYVSSEAATNLIVAAIAVVISVAWGLINKYVLNRKIDAALTLPAGSSRNKLK